MLISVIVPVYNAEKTLPRCLDSLLNQGLSEEEMEVVCVDDGSEDGSKDVVRSYAGKPGAHVRLVENARNMGCPASRNRGIEEAQGEIITFCDADDYLVKGAYRALIDRHWSEKVDVLRFTSRTMDAYSLKHWQEPADMDLRADYTGDGHGFYQRMMPYFVWQLMIRRRFVMEHGIRFRNYTLCDDSAFCLDLMMANPSMISVRANIYRYVVEPDSLTTARNPEKMRRIVDSYLQMMDSMQAYGKRYEELQQRMRSYVQQQMIPCLSRALSACYDRKEWQAAVAKMREVGGLPLTKAGRIGKCMGWATSDYVRYRLAGWCYRHVFVPYVLPRLKRNAS